MNDDPATEYALYDPTLGEYVIDQDMHVPSWPTEQMARGAAEGMGRADLEVHSRKNFAVTPWRAVPDRGQR